MIYTTSYKGYNIELSPSTIRILNPNNRQILKSVDEDMLCSDIIPIEYVYSLVDKYIQEESERRLSAAMYSKGTANVVGVFTGQDGSQGFKNGEKYRLHVRSSDTYPIILVDTHSPIQRCCPYSTVAAVLNNWRLV